ncbi:MAG: type II secretion system protein GspG, partial [Candidatus Poribacteria bacterium]|nr:type II secretion system protein GspG [Candidatus Poribacteria bacterium]
MLEKLWQRITGPDDDNQEGVTLIEITIVIVIIGLLASIIGPRVIGNVDKAKVSKAQLEIKNFSTALENYAIDVGSYP